MKPFDFRSSSTLPPIDQLLLSGGDERIVVDASTGMNRYGCAPRPEPEILAFGSSTASSVSQEGFAAASRLRERLLASMHAPAQAYARELERMRAELVSLCELDDIPPDIVFAASGTDLHLIAALLAAPARVIVAGAEETGRGVPQALAGRHFATRTALGHVVHPERAIDDATLEFVSVPVRGIDGMPRAAEDIDAEVEMLAQEGIGKGQRVLLVLVDVSKTGLIAPTPACAADLRRRFEGQLDVMVDACQFRLAPATLRAYLQAQFTVAVTGSKFLTGPTFCGALFFPAAVAQCMRERLVPPALSAYSARAEWPAHWAAGEALEDVANLGLLLRWEAALQELRAFRAIPATLLAQYLRSFTAAVEQRLRSDPAFTALPVPALHRFASEDKAAWDRIPTILPFLLNHPATGRPLTREQSVHIHQWLQQPSTATRVPRCRLGQPVDCGQHDGVHIAALRLCASTRLLVEAACAGGPDAMIEKAMKVLDTAVSAVRIAC